MKNYLARRYKRYYVQTADGRSIETTRAECIAPGEVPTAENPYKQRWFYDAENFGYIVRLPRNEQGEALYRMNAASAKSEERYAARKSVCVLKGAGGCGDDCQACQGKRFSRVVELDKPVSGNGEDDGEPQYLDIAGNEGGFTEIEEAEESEALLAAVEKLTAEQQRIIRLYYYEKKTLREISTAMSIHFSCVQRRLETAQNKLKKILEKNL